RWPLGGPHDLAALPCQLLCPRQSPLPHLPHALPRRHTPSRPPGAHRPPGLDHPLERPQSSEPPRLLRLHLPRPVCFSGRHCHQSSCRAHRPHGHLHLPPSGQCPPAHRPPRRHGVSPEVPPTRLARGLSESPPLRLSPCPLCRPARDDP